MWHINNCFGGICVYIAGIISVWVCAHEWNKLINYICGFLSWLSSDNTHAVNWSSALIKAAAAASTKEINHAIINGIKFRKIRGDQKHTHTHTHMLWMLRGPQ